MQCSVHVFWHAAGAAGQGAPPTCRPWEHSPAGPAATCRQRSHKSQLTLTPRLRGTLVRERSGEYSLLLVVCALAG